MNLDAPALPYESIYTCKTTGVDVHHSVFNLEWLDNPQVVLDVGAWDFGDSIRIKEAFPACKVHAFELLPSNFDRHSPNAIRCGVFPYNVAISDVNGEVPYFEGTHIHGDNAQSSLLSPDTKYEDTYRHIVRHTKQAQVTPAITLEQFCYNSGITDIDLLHVDVEGAEYKVFAGLGEMRPKMIFAEFLMEQGWVGQKPFQETLDLLDTLGYTVVKHLPHDKLFVRK